MNNEQRNKFIQNYFDNDKTNSAIMLNGSWGIGKSYYIKNELINHFKKISVDRGVDREKRKRYKNNIVIVSLYGLNSVGEISKDIYLQLRLLKRLYKIISKPSELEMISIIACKTLFRNSDSKLDLSQSVKDIEKFYKSIDLNNKLIILEDMERSNIDPIDILAFANSLVEHGNSKVVLVGNESEFKNGETSTVKYELIKEKTVGDTINFYPSNINDAIEKIMKSYGNTHFKKIIQCKDGVNIFREVESIMRVGDISNYNLRAFKCACQKFCDIFRDIDYDFDCNFLSCVFLSLVAFFLRKNKCDKIRWTDEFIFSTKLGTHKYPLCKCFYDYIFKHTIDAEAVKFHNDEFVKQQFKKENNNEVRGVLEKIFNYSVEKESDITRSIEKLKELLSDNKISINLYGKIGNYIIAIKSIGCAVGLIDECKILILENLRLISASRQTKYAEIAAMTRTSIDGELGNAEYSEFEAKLKAICYDTNNIDRIYKFSTNNVEKVCEDILVQKGKLMAGKQFASKIDLQCLIETLMECSASQIQDIRSMFLSMYGASNVKNFLHDDKDTLNKILTEIDEIIEQESFDKIQKMQMQYLTTNLKDIISLL